MPRRNAADATDAVTPLDKLFRHHRDAAWRLAFSVTHNRDDASDAVAEAFAGILKAVARGPFGPYADPLSGFSEVLFDFAGGDGQFGIHGTNDASTLGGDVSHGCIRMSNVGITLLAGTLPAGVPVRILP